MSTPGKLPPYGCAEWCRGCVDPQCWDMHAVLAALGVETVEVVGDFL